MARERPPPLPFDFWIQIESKQMPKASEIKKNSAIEYNGNVYIIKTIERSVPQGREGGSSYRMRM